MVNTIKCFDVPPLPLEKGYRENIGVSNMLCGVIDNKIVLGGGSNFPFGTALEGGKRVIHKFLHLIRPVENSFQILDTTEFEQPVADGKCVSFSGMLFYVGGNRILKINVINNKLHVQEYANLNFSIEQHIAHIYNGIIYYGLGKINGEISDRFFAFNIFTQENKEISSFPASGRIQCVSEIFEDEIVVFSGANNIAYTEGYKYNIRKKIWIKISDVKAGNKKISIVGAGNIKINDKEMVVIGGFNKKIWDEACKKFATFKSEDKNKFRQFYFSQEASYFNWNKKLLIYNYKLDSWTSPGEISFPAPCGNSLVCIHNSIYSIMGEIRPGIRTNKSYRIPLEKINR
jgi:hypothetical protein